MPATKTTTPETLTLDVFSVSGEKQKTLALDADIFGVKPDTGLLHDVVEAHLANQRLGLAHTKTKGEVRGGGKKPWKQKGTGRARTGSIRNPQWRGGGVTFGPRTGANHTKKINVKAKRKALAMALSAQVAAKHLILVESMPTDGKTKTVHTLLTKLAARRRALLVPAAHSPVIVRATRNHPEVTVLRSDSLNVYDVLRAHRVVLSVDSLPVIRKTFFASAAKA